MKSDRIFQLDLFRFIAAISVVLFHYSYRLQYKKPNESYRFIELESITQYGYLGVDFFFMISGFVIFLSVKHGSVNRFIISRLSRLYPAYWISILLTTLCILIFSNPDYTVSLKQFLANLTMFHRYIGIPSVDGVYWSLMVEMKFYIMIGLFLFFNQIKNIKYIIIAWLLISILTIFLEQSMLFTKVLSFALITNYSSLFIAGMLFYLMYAGENCTLYNLLLLVCLSLSLYNGIEITKILEARDGVSFNSFIASGIIVVQYVLFYLISNGKLKILNKSYFLVIGAITYPLYLIHQNIGYLILEKYSTITNRYSLLIALILGAILISYFISRFWEIPISKLIRKKCNIYLSSKHLQ